MTAQHYKIAAIILAVSTAYLGYEYWLTSKATADLKLAMTAGTVNAALVGTQLGGTKVIS